VLAHPELELAGLHCHLGSQLTELNLGGGHAVPYVEGDEGFDLAQFAERVRRVVAAECASFRLPVPRLVVEPGRAIVNRAMVTLHRVLAVKHVTGVRTFVAVDGGMSDNPRPELYGARYSVHAMRPSRAPMEPVTVVGRHCEAGDVLAADVPLPADVRPGDLLAVPGTGAYNHSMASNYNLVGRPPVIAVRDGAARLLVRRETTSDLLVRDIGR
jgi:diaminopimelate decarboxylase